MTIEQQITEMEKASAEQTAASLALAQEVAGKMEGIDARVDKAIEEFNAEVDGVVDTIVGFGSYRRVFVYGDEGRYYPVGIQTRISSLAGTDIVEIANHISRKPNAMSGTARLIFSDDGWGGKPYVFYVDHLSKIGSLALIAKHVLKSWGPELFIWLPAHPEGAEYYIRIHSDPNRLLPVSVCDGGSSPIDSEQNVVRFPDGYIFQENESSYQINSIDAVDTYWSNLGNNYIRGV